MMLNKIEKTKTKLLTSSNISNNSQWANNISDNYLYFAL